MDNNWYDKYSHRINNKYSTITTLTGATDNDFEQNIRIFVDNILNDNDVQNVLKSPRGGQLEVDLYAYSMDQGNHLISIVNKIRDEFNDKGYKVRAGNTNMTINGDTNEFVSLKYSLFFIINDCPSSINNE